MNVAENFHSIEVQFRVSYPGQFYDFIHEFAELAEKPEFNELFRRHHFFSTADFSDSLAWPIWKKFLPFFIVEYDGFEEYYCFMKEGNEDQRIVVLADDGIVFRWENASQFLNWIRQKIGS